MNRLATTIVRRVFARDPAIAGPMQHRGAVGARRHLTLKQRHEGSLVLHNRRPRPIWRQ